MYVRACSCVLPLQLNELDEDKKAEFIGNMHSPQMQERIQVRPYTTTTGARAYRILQHQVWMEF